MNDLRALHNSQIEAYYEGVKEGLRLYSWMKDGTTYVGTCGKTLKEALESVDDEKIRRIETIDSESFKGL